MAANDGFAAMVREVLADSSNLPAEFLDYINQYQAVNPISVGAQVAPMLIPSGTKGATADTRLVGATTSGAPASGSFLVGDTVTDNSGAVWICTVAGSPGTWKNAGSSGNVVTSVFGRTGAVAANTGDYTAAQVTNAADKSSAATQAFTGEISTPKVIENNPAVNIVTVPTMFTPDISTGLIQRVQVNAGGANTLTIAAPSNPPSGAQTALLVVQILNFGGGTITITWNPVYVGSVTTALPTSRATSTGCDVLFVWDGGNWRIVSVG